MIQIILIMIGFPPSKLNLGLQIIAKRTDGYHDLQTIFYQFPLYDILEIIIDESLEPGQCKLISSGLTILKGENLCEKAYKLLHKSHHLPGVKIFLHKIIPIGAGLGGGSSDAAYTLKLLNMMFNLKLSNDELKALALILGSDCPLFINHNPQYGEGRGEVLSHVDIDLSGKYLLLIHPGIHVSSKSAYLNVIPKVSRSCKLIVQGDIKSWRHDLVNDFEAYVIQNYPELADVKAKLYAMGADYAAMSGSGSSFFGIFSNPISHKDWPSNYFIWKTVL